MTQVQAFTIPSPDNGEAIAGYRLPGAGPNTGPGLLLVGGYGQQGPLGKLLGRVVFTYAQARGLDCVALDFRGQGQSGGERWGMTIPGMTSDIFAMADHLALQGRIGIGASLGAWAMLAAQQRRPQLLRGMIALAPAFDWDRTYFSPRQADGRLQTRPDGKLAESGAAFMISRPLLDTAEEWRLRSDGIALSDGLDVLHGTADELASFDHAAVVVRGFAQHISATMQPVPGEDHSLSTLTSPLAQQLFVQHCDALLQRCGVAPGSPAPEGQN